MTDLEDVEPVPGVTCQLEAIVYTGRHQGHLKTKKFLFVIIAVMTKVKTRMQHLYILPLNVASPNGCKLICYDVQIGPLQKPNNARVQK